MGMRPPPRDPAQEALAQQAKANLQDYKDRFIPLDKRTLRPVRCRCGTLATITAIEKGKCAYCEEPLPT